MVDDRGTFLNYVPIQDKGSINIVLHLQMTLEGSSLQADTTTLTFHPAALPVGGCLQPGFV
jgi:hypothetical protein